MAATVTSGLIPWAYEPTLAKMVEDAANHPDVAEQIVGKEPWTLSPDKRQFTSAKVAGMGPMQNGGEMTPFNYDTPAPAGSKTTAYAEYNLAARFTRNAIEDQVTQVFDKVGDSMGRGFRLLRNILVARLLANATSTTYFTGPDGKAILATDHTSYRSGSNRANTLAVSKSLSYSAVQELITIGLRQKDEGGYPEPAWDMGEELGIVYQPENWGDVDMLFSAESMREPGNNNNDPNRLRNFRWKPISNPYLDASSAVGRPWFLLRGGRKTVYFVDRRELTTGSWRHPVLGFVDFFGHCRFCLHVEDWTYIYGSGF